MASDDEEYNLLKPDEEEEIPVVAPKKQVRKRKPKDATTAVVAESAEQPKDDEVRIKMKEFDMATIPPHNIGDKSKGVKIVVIGKPGTGKSSIIADILWHKSSIVPCAQIFSGTEDSNHFYSEKFPSICVFNKLDLDAVRNFVVRQKLAKRHLENPWAFQIIDDCTDDPTVFKKPLFQAYYKNGRHWCMIHILSLQYCMDVSTVIRTNIDFSFILREPQRSNRERLHKNFVSCVHDFNDFNDIMDQITEDFTCLVVNNTVQSNKIEDCLFWYKADPNRFPKNWKFGSPDAWKFHNKRYDTNYQDPIEFN
jgi:hypothetical protein